MTPAVVFIEEWERISKPYKYPCRQIPGLGKAVLSRTKSNCHISLCSIYAEKMKKGLGTKLLQVITDLADKHGVFLEVVPMRGKEHLKPWYEKHGFTEMALDNIALMRPFKVSEKK